MTSIGETLRQERMRRDLGLEQISHDLKISSRFLEAIEDEHFEKLPGGVFAKSFVRQYARYLGLDDDEYAAAVQQAVEPEIPPELAPALPAAPPDISVPRVEEWQSVGERRFNWSSSLPALALVVVVMLVCSGIYTWWQRNRRGAQLNEAAPKAAQTAHAPQAPVQPTAVPPQPAPVVPASTTSGPAAPANSPAASESAQAPASETASPATGASLPGASVKVEIAATAPVWVQARADGKFLFSGTIEANQSRSVEANDTLTLKLGSAGAAQITLNGKPIGAVGSIGQVRTLQFTSGGFQIVAAPKPSVPADPL